MSSVKTGKTGPKRDSKGRFVSVGKPVTPHPDKTLHLGVRVDVAREMVSLTHAVKRLEATLCKADLRRPHTASGGSFLSGVVVGGAAAIVAQYVFANYGHLLL